MAAFFGRTKADVYIYLFMIVYVVAAYACRAYLKIFSALLSAAVDLHTNARDCGMSQRGLPDPSQDFFALLPPHPHCPPILAALL